MEAFADSRKLQMGDTVSAVINGRRQELTVVGVALSPEYIIQIHGANLLPDDRRFGIFWMGYDQLAAAVNMDGAFNDINLTLMRGANGRAVIELLDELLKPYGTHGASDRDEHVSHRNISDEIRQLRSMGLIAPTIFFSVATFLLNVVLSQPGPGDLTRDRFHAGGNLGDPARRVGPGRSARACRGGAVGARGSGR